MEAGSSRAGGVTDAPPLLRWVSGEMRSRTRRGRTRPRGTAGLAVLVLSLFCALLPPAAVADDSCQNPSDPVAVESGSNDACAKYVAISNSGDATASSADTVFE